MSQVAITFDYDQLAPTVQDSLRAHAQHLGKLAQNTAVNLWEMGGILTQAQGELAAHGNGTFAHWIETETGLSRRTAYRLINVHETFDCAKLAQTSFANSALYLLSEPSTPPQARAEALQRAERGETIAYSTAQQIVRHYKPPPQAPPAPPANGAYHQYEREQLRPWLHDAGLPEAPQIVSGRQEPLPSALPSQKQRARTNLRAAIVERLSSPPIIPEDCADAILDILGQGSNSIAIAARFGAELACGPRTLGDLTQVVIQVCGQYAGGMERDEFLRWRKRAQRMIDSLTYNGSLGIFQHELDNGQIVFDLLPAER